MNFQSAVVTPGPKRGRRIVGTVIVLVVASAVAYSAAWFYGAAKVREAAAEWVAQREAAGMVADYDQLAVDGFPFVFRITVAGPYFASAAVPGAGARRAWSWRASRAVAELTPWRWRHPRIDLAGTHRIELGGAAAASMEVQVGMLTADLLLNDALRPRDVSVDALDLTVHASRADFDGSVGRMTFHLSRSGAQTASHLKSTVAFGLSLQDAALPKVLNLVLGHDLKRLFVEGTLQGLVPPGPLPASLASWRDAGGTVEIAELDVRYGPMSAQANGTVALDGELQPMGALTAQFSGFFETVDQLQRAGLVRARDATMARLVLGALARGTAADGSPAVQLPLSVQDRTLAVGPVSLLRFKPVNWRGNWPAF